MLFKKILFLLPVSIFLNNKFIYMRLENSFNFSDEYFNLDLKNNYYLSGFWFNECYFSNIKDTILLNFVFHTSLHNHPLLNTISNCESVSIHLRCGDYLNSEFDVLTPNYYQNAIFYISERINDPVFFVFSDDLEYAKKYFDFLPNKHIVSENQESNSYKDLFFMSKCKHNINANSSFSFWGAYLNRNENKIVIAPNVYMKNRDDYPNCTSWIIINAHDTKSD